MLAAALLCLALAAAPAPDAGPAAAPSAAAPRLRVAFRTEALPTLLYHLHLLSGVEAGSDEALRALWRSELALGPADEPLLAEWRARLERYSATLELATRPPLPINAPPEWDLRSKVLLAGFSATSLAELRERLALVVAPADAERLAALAAAFLPRFEPWFARAGRAPAQAFALGFERLLGEKDLLALLERAAAFYGAALPAAPLQQDLVLHVVLRPRTEAERKGAPVHTTARLYEHHAVIEVPESERPEDRVDVVLHELFHHLYWSRPPEAQRGLLEAFVRSGDPNALGLYTILDEALATALGNGLVAERVLSPERFAALLAREGGFYSEPFIDACAKAVLRPLEERLAAGGALDAAFARDFLRLASERLGPRVGSPRLLLKTRALVLPDATYRPHAEALRRAFRPINTSLHLASERWALELFPKMSGVVFARVADLEVLEGHPRIFPAATLAAIRAQAKRSRGFVHGVRRDPQAEVYVVVGADDAALAEALRLFLAKDERFEGTGIDLPR